MQDNHFHVNHLLADQQRQLRKARELGLGYGMGPSGFRPYQEVAIRWHLEQRVAELEAQLEAERHKAADLSAARRIATDNLTRGPYFDKAARELASGSRDHTTLVRAVLAGIRFGRGS